MSIEERLRDAVRAATDDIHPDEAAGLTLVRARGRAARRRRRAVLGGVAGALVLTVSALAVTRTGEDGRQSIVLSGGPSSTATDSTVTAPPTTAPPPTEPPAPTTIVTTTPTTAPAVPSAAASDHVIWPGPGQPVFDDAISAARSFVEEFVGLADPPLGELRSTGDGVGAVDVYGRTESGAVHDRVVSTIDVRLLDGHWFVTGAVADEVRIDSPAAGSEVASPVRVQGRARGFEGTVVVEVRDAFRPAGENLGREVTIAGCCGDDLGPFDLAVMISDPAAPMGVVLARTDTGLAQGTFAFTAIAVRFAPTAGEASEVTTLKVFFTKLTDGAPAGLVAVRRTVPKTTGVLRASLVALLDGPTEDEVAVGLVSSSGADDGGAVEGVNIRAGHVTVRLSSRLPETSPAPPADDVIAELNATVFQFTNFDMVRYELGESSAAFDAWLHRGCEFIRGSGSVSSSTGVPAPDVGFVCPEGDLVDMAELQAQVDAGHEPWRLSAPDVAAACTFGIAGTTVEPVRANAFRVTEAGTGRTVVATVVQPVRPGSGGIWVVTGLGPIEGTAPGSLEGASDEAVLVPATGCCDPGPFVLLTDVTAQQQPGFDRVVFEFSSPVANYHVRYVPLPLTADPSDLPVALQGDSALQVSVGATGTDQTVIPARQIYTGPTRLAVGTGAVIELVQTGDFEAVLNWAIGVRGRPPFRVSTESDPPRLVIDVASP